MSLSPIALLKSWSTDICICSNGRNWVVLDTQLLPELIGLSDRVAVMHEGALQGILPRAEATQERIMELASRGRDPRLRELREMVVVVGVEKYGQRVRELAEVLRKNPGSVSRWVTSAAERRTSDSGIAKRLTSLDNAVQNEGETHGKLEL